MGNSKVIFGNETLIDLTGDTVTPDTLLAGTTAHNRSGEQIVGTATVPEELDDLTDVTITSPAEGDLLQRNGNGDWVNSAVIPQKVAGLQKTGCVNRLPITGISEVVNGVTWTVVKDANGNVTGVTATGATGANASNFYTGVTSIGSGVYKLTGCPAGGGDNAYYMHPKVNNSWSNDIYEYGDGIIVNGSVENCAITIAPNYTISGTLRFKPMLSDDLSATYDDYQPYSMTNRELTEAVEELHNNAFGEPISVGTSWGTRTTITSDGIFAIMCDSSKNNYVNGMLYSPSLGTNLRLLAVSTPIDYPLASRPSLSCIVKKGMQLYAESNDFTVANNKAQFYPFVS